MHSRVKDRPVYAETMRERGRTCDVTDYAAMGKSEQRALVESIVKIANLRACTQMVITPRPLVQQHQRKLTLTALSSSYTHDCSIAVWKVSTSTVVWCGR